VYSTPPSAQSFSSSGSIEREALEMSVSPAQNFSNPPLVPAAPTVASISGFSSPNNSTAASANGCTVLEPSIEIEPERPLGVSPPPALLDSSSSPHAATPKARAVQAATANSHFMDIN
jgi:hypothetical protein